MEEGFVEWICCLVVLGFVRFFEFIRDWTTCPSDPRIGEDGSFVVFTNEGGFIR